MDILAEINRVMDLEGRTLAKLRAAVGPAYEKAVRLLFDCPGKVIVTGIGKSGIIAQKIASTMVSTGTHAMFLHPSEAAHGDIGIARKDDVILAITKSGESDEIIALLPSIRQIGARLISITAMAESALARQSDIVLLTPVEEEACPLNMAPTCSTTAALVVGDALAMALMKLRNFQPDEFALYHPGGQIGKRLLLTVRDLMRTGKRNPVVDLKASVPQMFSELTAKHLGAVSIVDDKGRLAGLVTDYDIRRVVGEGKNIFAMSLKDIMNPNPVRVNVDEKAVQALKIMEEREKPFAVLPVVDADSVVRGMIHLHDLIDKGL
ncbi:MAG: KpsF/GutQ family sugar-phosphate isomerase [Nitrospirae bacterium]|nr:MAG: KpsF/GutQ family sugar-phosphate isomerase [Nitrospirota bacterium]